MTKAKDMLDTSLSYIVFLRIFDISTFTLHTILYKHNLHMSKAVHVFGYQVRCVACDMNYLLRCFDVKFAVPCPR